MDERAEITAIGGFLEKYQQDLDSGNVASLRSYLQLFPDHEEAVAAEFLRLRSDEEATEIARDHGVGDCQDPEQRLGPYQLIRELGRGGQGVVYLARDPRLDRPVALKVLVQGLSSTDSLPRFRREAAVASKLDHPGICTVYEAGVAEGLPYIAMRFVEGMTLAERIKTTREETVAQTSSCVTLPTERDRPPPAGTPEEEKTRSMGRPAVVQVVAMVEKVARALHAAHEAGIIHRDVKPGNIMTTTEGEPLIMDFGLARDTERHAQTLTRTGELFGTPAYMSPEQLAHQSISLDRRTDIWSLGVALYESLTLRRPFEAPTREALYQAIMTKEPAEAESLNPAIPRDLSIVLATALEKDRDRRYQTALDFAEDLRRVGALEPIRARPPGKWNRLSRWTRRNPALAASLASAFFFLIGGLVVSLVLLAKSQQDREARMEALKLKEAALDHYEQMSDEILVSSLERRARDLWPRRPEKVPAMESWLAEARTLHTRLPLHEQALARLRSRAALYSEEERERDDEERRRLHPDLMEELDQKKERLESVRKALSGDVSSRRRTAFEEEALDLEETIREQLEDPRLAGRITYTLGDPRDAWRHKVLADLVGRLRRFERSITKVEQRKAFATDVRRRSLEEEALAWSACVQDVRRNPRYRQLQLAPQIGLVPLGKDQDSKLWEFCHLGVGSRPQWEGDLLSGRVKLEEGSGLVLVLLPGGVSTMGAQADDASGLRFDRDAAPDESPVHVVPLQPFFISKFEMTQEQWRLLMGANRSYYAFPGTIAGRMITPLHPTENVSWIQARDALRTLDLLLPTEAQWEYAARAGTESRWWTGNEVKSLQGAANVGDRSGSRVAAMPLEKTLDDGHAIHAPVGSFRANQFGLHDVVGNVWEWCRDRPASYDTPATGPDGFRDSPRTWFRVARGAGFNSPARDGRSANRFRRPPDTPGRSIGIRPTCPVRR